MVQNQGAKAFSWKFYYISTIYRSTKLQSGPEDTKACNKKNLS
jgi:hypothetical protein